MPDKNKLLGISKLSTDNKMTLIEEAAELLNARKGDKIAFYDRGGKIYLEKI